VILLDTNALIWLDKGHRRGKGLAGRTLYVSPATILELQVLSEGGRLQLPRGGAQELAADERWLLDEPPAAAWFREALELSFTREPFDRLLAAHARLRGWRLATADTRLLEGLGPRYTFEL